MQLTRAPFRLAAAGLIGAAALAPGRPARAADREACFSAAETAQQLRAQGRLRAARERLLVCAREDCPITVQGDCAGWLAEVNDAMPTVVVVAHDATGNDLTAVRVLVDDQQVADHLDGRPIPVDVGAHKVHAESAGFQPVDRTLVIAAGQKLRTIELSLQSEAVPQPPARSRLSIPPVALVLGGVGVLALASTAYFWIAGRSEFSSLQSSCAPSCDPSRADPIRTKLIVGDVSLGVAVASLGVAAWLTIAQARHGMTAPAAAVGVEPLPGGALAGIRARF
jgi:hypothetical protein